MGTQYKKALGFLILLSFLMISTGNIQANTDIAPDSARVIPEQGTVHIITGNRISTVSDQGLNLDDGDEIITDQKSRASVLLSMLSEYDEILVGPSSRIKISIRVSTSFVTIYQVHLLYGKIRVNTILNHSKQFLFSTGQAEVSTDEGEFILEGAKKGTTIGVISGIVKLTTVTSNREYHIAENTNMFVSHFDSVSPKKMFSYELFRGVEKHDWERAPDVEQLFLERKKKEKAEQQRQALIKQQEQEKKRKEAEAARKAALQKALDERKKQQQINEEIKVQSPVIEEQAEEVPEAAPREESLVEAEPLPEEPVNEESFFSKYLWHIVASSTFVTFNYLALQEANSYNDLASQNDDLQTQYNNSTSTTERASLQTEYEVNKEKMSKHKSYMQLYNIMAIGALAWEGYLLYDLFFGDETEDEKSMANYGYPIGQDKTLNFDYLPQNSEVRFSFSWSW